MFCQESHLFHSKNQTVVESRASSTWMRIHNIRPETDSRIRAVQSSDMLKRNIGAKFVDCLNIGRKKKLQLQSEPPLHSMFCGQNAGFSLQYVNNFIFALKQQQSTTQKEPTSTLMRKFTASQTRRAPKWGPGQCLTYLKIRHPYLWATCGRISLQNTPFPSLSSQVWHTPSNQKKPKIISTIEFMAPHFCWNASKSSTSTACYAPH